MFNIIGTQSLSISYVFGRCLLYHFDYDSWMLDNTFLLLFLTNLLFLLLCNEYGNDCATHEIPSVANYGGINTIIPNHTSCQTVV